MVEGKKDEHVMTKGELVVQTDKVAEPVVQQSKSGWVPKTRLGQDVLAGKVTSVSDIFEKGLKISEAGIVDHFFPELKSEIILIGGSSGKGGGIRRTPSRRTSRMHKSGRRYRLSVMAVVGNEDGYVGAAIAHGPVNKNREVVTKAMTKAKLSLIPVSRGCGSWECNCAGPHSIPFTVIGKSGSVRVKLVTAPKGIGLCVSSEAKKILRLAGIHDVWCKTSGRSQSRVNFIKAIYNALKQIDAIRTQEKFSKNVGLKVG